MKAEITNATSVHLFYGDDEVGELLGVFQYFRQAESFARAQIKEAGDSCIMIVACSHDGSTRRITKPSIKETEE